MIYNSKSFKVVMYMLMAFLVLSCIIPLIILVSSSFSSESSLALYGYGLWPREFSLASYKYLSTISDSILHSYLMSFVITLLGTVINVAISMLFAYPLSKPDLPGRRAISFFLFFPMLFNGGFVSTYLIYTNIFHINDTLAAMIVPYLLMNPFFVIMIRTYLTSSIPSEVLESGRIDGANEMDILLKLVVPMSRPILGTVGLMTAISYWNNWTNGVYFISRRKDLYGIQNYLNNVMANVSFLQAKSSSMFNVTQLPSIGIRMALAVIAIIPILAIYPFFQKSFVKGITIGSVKG